MILLAMTNLIVRRFGTASQFEFFRPMIVSVISCARRISPRVSATTFSVCLIKYRTQTPHSVFVRSRVCRPTGPLPNVRRRVSPLITLQRDDRAQLPAAFCTARAFRASAVSVHRFQSSAIRQCVSLRPAAIPGESPSDAC